MKKKYAFLLTLFFILSFSVFTLSCSKDDDYVLVTDLLPVATDDFATYALLETVEIPILANDTNGDDVISTSVSLIGGTDTDSNGSLNELIVSGQGTWSVNPSTGVVTFTPEPTFQLEPTPIKYTVEDLQENVSNQATITITAIQTAAVDLTQVPYPKLSDYNFFAGEMKNQIPSLGVLPYKPISALFTDYAQKKRFVWMPNGTTATFEGDEQNLELPVGAVLIKNFYYENTLPSNSTRIIETRLMIRKSDGWIFAEYIWNDDQSEAFLNMEGAYTSVSWLENGVTKSVPQYRIPSEVECLTCHKKGTTPIPIGIKPQSLNSIYEYQTGIQNQLSKWVAMGYLENNIPNSITSVVDYNDTSKSLDQRVRSYLDINCAHCHSDEGQCSYRDLRLRFVDTTVAANLGICLTPVQPLDGVTGIVVPGNHERSAMYYMLNNNEGNTMMPLIGRTIIHQEGVALIQQWINSLNGCN